MAERTPSAPSSIMHTSVGRATTTYSGTSAVDTQPISQTVAYLLEMEHNDIKNFYFPEESSFEQGLDVTSYEIRWNKPHDSQRGASKFITGKVAGSALYLTMPTGPHTPVVLMLLHNNTFMQTCKLKKMVITGGMDKPAVSETILLTTVVVGEVTLSSERALEIMLLYDAIELTTEGVDKQTGQFKGKASFNWLYGQNTGGGTAA